MVQGLPFRVPRHAHLEPAAKLGRVLHWLDHQHLPFELGAIEYLGLQRTDGEAAGAAQRDQILEETEVVTQRMILRFERFQALRNALLRRLLGGELQPPRC